MAIFASNQNEISNQISNKQDEIINEILKAMGKQLVKVKNEQESQQNVHAALQIFTTNNHATSNTAEIDQDDKEEVLGKLMEQLLANKNQGLGTPWGKHVNKKTTASDILRWSEDDWNKVENEFSKKKRTLGKRLILNLLRSHVSASHDRESFEKHVLNAINLLLIERNNYFSKSREKTDSYIFKIINICKSNSGLISKNLRDKINNIIKPLAETGVIKELSESSLEGSRKESVSYPSSTGSISSGASSEDEEEEKCEVNSNAERAYGELYQTETKFLAAMLLLNFRLQAIKENPKLKLPQWMDNDFFKNLQKVIESATTMRPILKALLEDKSNRNKNFKKYTEFLESNYTGLITKFSAKYGTRIINEVDFCKEGDVIEQQQQNTREYQESGSVANQNTFDCRLESLFIQVTQRIGRHSSLMKDQILKKDPQLMSSTKSMVEIALADTNFQVKIADAEVVTEEFLNDRAEVSIESIRKVLKEYVESAKERAEKHKKVAIELIELRLKSEDLKGQNTKLQGQIRDKENNLEKINAELNALEGRFAQLQDELTKKGKNIQELLTKIENLTSENSEKKEKLLELNTENQKINSELDKAQKEKLEIEEQVDRLTKSNTNKDRALQELIVQVASKQKEVTNLGEQLKIARSEIQEKVESLNRLEQEVQTYKSTVSENEAKIDALEGKLATGTKENQQLQKQIESLQSYNKKLHNKLRVSEQEKQEVENQVDELRCKNADNAGVIARQQKEITRSKAEAEKSQQEISRLNSQCNETRDRLNTLEPQIEEFQIAIARDSKKIEVLQAENSKLHKENESLRQAVDEKPSEIRNLEDVQVENPNSAAASSNLPAELSASTKLLQQYIKADRHPKKAIILGVSGVLLLGGGIAALLLGPIGLVPAIVLTAKAVSLLSIAAGAGLGLGVASTCAGIYFWNRTKKSENMLSSLKSDSGSPSKNSCSASHQDRGPAVPSCA